MESFKIYLPSNASHDRYPNNTASNYKTNLSNPMRLNGEWEAGVESIYYNGNIGDKNGTSTITVTTKTHTPSLVNDIYPFKFELSSKKKWLYREYYPKAIPSSSQDLKAICEALNSVNRQILANKDQKIFEFYLRNGKVSFHSFTDSFTIEITNNMAKKLGYAHQTRCRSYKQAFGRIEDIQLVKADYMVYVFEESIVKQHERIYIKTHGEDFLSNRKLKTSWETNVKRFYNIELFFKKGKVIITNREKNLALVFSRAFRYAIFHTEAIFTENEWWGHLQYYNDPTVNYKEVEWYVDIYKDELASTTVTNYSHFEHTFHPHHFTIEALLLQLNNDIERKIQVELKDDYNDKYHKCFFSFKNNFVAIEIAHQTEITIDEVLQSMLGFSSSKLKPGLHEANAIPRTLNMQMQRLYIHGDFIQAISYGTEKENILQEFMHEFNKENVIIEKRFEPISYIPVAQNYIETIGIKLTNDKYIPIKIVDSKTVLVIHFRKVK